MLKEIRSARFAKLPDDWDIASLGECCDIINSSLSYSALSSKKIEQSPGSVKVMGVKVSDMNLPGNAIRFETANLVRYLPLEEAQNRAIPPKAIVFPKRVAAIATNKKRITTTWTVLDPNLIGVFPKDRITSDYLYFWSQTFDLPSITDPGPTPQLNKKDLIPVLIQFPSNFKDQSKITLLLSTVQRAIEQQEQLIALTMELKKALMHKLFTEGTRGEPQKETEIGLVPESWEVTPLGDFAKIGNGSTPKRSNKAYWDGGDIPWLTSGKIHEGIINGADEFVTTDALSECHLPLVKANSVLVAITGQGKTLGNSAVVTFDTCVSQHLAYITINADGIIPRFLLYYLQNNYENLRQLSVGAGSTKRALTCGILKQYLVPLPNVSEQMEILSAFELLDKKIETHKEENRLFQDLFQTLLNQLMTAQIRVNDIDLAELGLETEAQA